MPSASASTISSTTSSSLGGAMGSVSFDEGASIDGLAIIV